SMCLRGVGVERDRATQWRNSLAPLTEPEQRLAQPQLRSKAIAAVLDRGAIEIDSLAPPAFAAKFICALNTAVCLRLLRWSLRGAPIRVKIRIHVLAAVALPANAIAAVDRGLRSTSERRTERAKFSGEELRRKQSDYRQHPKMFAATADYIGVGPEMAQAPQQRLAM
ncbi:MAG TPA: hypothetical protein VJ476_15985, partial [Rhizomicrobium sp.]|nr:hypothetical protein [Rhizomicrobium sp.]